MPPCDFPVKVFEQVFSYLDLWHQTWKPLLQTIIFWNCLNAWSGMLVVQHVFFATCAVLTTETCLQPGPELVLVCGWTAHVTSVGAPGCIGLFYPIWCLRHSANRLVLLTRLTIQSHIVGARKGLDACRVSITDRLSFEQLFAITCDRQVWMMLVLKWPIITIMLYIYLFIYL